MNTDAPTASALDDAALRFVRFVRPRLGTIVICILFALEVLAMLLVLQFLTVTWRQVMGFVISTVCFALLLTRHRTWRWSLPLVMLLSFGRFPFAHIAMYGYAKRQPSRMRTGAWLGGTITAHVAWNVGSYFLTGERERLINDPEFANDPITPTFEAVMITSLELIALLSLSLAMAIGIYVAMRRERTAAMEDRLRIAQEGRRAAVEQARASERTRIAREMHDIVAHKISLIALQAGAMEVNDSLTREQMAEGTALIRSTASNALTELRQVLGVLRDEDTSAPLTPQPAWSDVIGLVETSNNAGARIELDNRLGDDAVVPEAVARTAYRVLQECLTNVHKHALNRAALVVIGRCPLEGADGSEAAGQRALCIEVHNRIPDHPNHSLPGARMGLVGIEERVKQAGGTFRVLPSARGDFTVRAEIPWGACPTS
ncbi:histidine kinase [Helcobacillus massiliensis]|uniref:sensor histidine kinase n=1 Tax=Helcobacillus TaxID=1161125 RepID=UPI001EF695B7|nr:histidine kinase [Helcobacillus massiliensis]MCG7427274.1 histidine kinase [Helcobacillus sp. ACRRO]MCT1556541.1 histidine kinase [Helcobacillus massiliensis]MCT2035735.1 histidine kinase [Helcobacillus massiliensis]MCT2331183.1 histidine kinase [Helcobacillus massiliensis]MDK7741938.1 histidine kinase [Helcobacillus massiliensis]